MRVVATARFMATVKKLERNSSYTKILADVCMFLADKDIQELHQMNDIINTHPGKYSLNKYRIANSLTNKGKSASYRCICVCLPMINMVCLDYIYPKTGSHGKDNIDKDEYKQIAKNALSAIQSNRLHVLDLKEQQFAPLD